MLHDSTKCFVVHDIDDTPKKKLKSYLTFIVDENM